MIIYKGKKNFYKGIVFQYAGIVYGLEIGALLPWILLELSRYFLGTRGNKMEEFTPTAIFLVLTMISFFIQMFYFVWQSYV
jgi:cell division protein FtsX